MITPGTVYQFNQVRARVLSADGSTVTWQESPKPGKRRVPKTLRSTPRWFFEKHATEVSQ